MRGMDMASSGELLMALSSTVTLALKSCGTHHHIELTQEPESHASPPGCNQSQSEVTTNGKSAGLFWCQAPICCT